MQRYAQEKQRCAELAKKYAHRWGYKIEPGCFRKSRRIGGCGKARCHLCHSDKFPKRKLTHQEIKSLYKFYEGES